MRNIKFFAVTMTTAALSLTGCKSYTPKETTDGYPIYHGHDLGVSYSSEKTLFKVWAPSASEVLVRLYDQGEGGEPLETYKMNPYQDGTWILQLKGDRKNLFYTFQALIDNEWRQEVPDIHAKAVGVNGKRGMIVDLASTNPPGWENDRRPVIQHFTDMIIWEIHIRDFSIHPSSGVKNPGKYLAFTEEGTRSPEGERTCLDHLVELGITHVHLLPAFDFATVDESKPDIPQYNWGYDPQNYNVPEGSYATDPYDGNVRIREFKQMVQALHSKGIGVIMDVVYNHVYHVPSSPFENLVPGYYFRKNKDGSLSNGSGCGNETASEKAMMRKFMIESLVYWATEYHIDGFRFDLMGLHDIETMNQIRQALNQVDPGIFMYGEGWTGGESPLPEEQRALKLHAAQMPGIAVFSDDIRDAIRGPWWEHDVPGFMAGHTGLEESIRFGVAAATEHPQVDYNKINYSKAPYAASPLQTITYVTCHDNPCLWDKIESTCRHCSKAAKLDIQKFANAIVLTSQGVAFLHAGEELVRSKKGEHNSYNLPDSINQLVWSNKHKYNEIFQYYRKLVTLRRHHPAFRMTSTDMIQQHLTFLEMPMRLMVGFKITGNANGDSWKEILVFYNANSKMAEVQLPEGRWSIVATNLAIEEEGFTAKGIGSDQEGKTIIAPRSMMMLVDANSIR